MMLSCMSNRVVTKPSDNKIGERAISVAWSSPETGAQHERSQNRSIPRNPYECSRHVRMTDLLPIVQGIG